MLNLNEVWKNIKPSPQTKILWFDTPEEAGKYLRDIVKIMNDNIQIMNDDDEEINKDEASRILDEYCFFQADKAHLELVERINNHITISLECWGLQNDCDCYADVLTFSFDSAE